MPSSVIREKRQKALFFVQLKGTVAPLSAFPKNIFGAPGLILHGAASVKQRKETVLGLPIVFLFKKKLYCFTRSKTVSSPKSSGLSLLASMSPANSAVDTACWLTTSLFRRRTESLSAAAS